MPTSKSKSRRTNSGRLGAFFVALVSLSSVVAAMADDAITYADHVRPIFAQRCLSCHNPDKASGGLSLSSYQAAMAGSSGGEVVAPGDPDASPLVGVISHTREPRMPPIGDKLSDEAIATIRQWIAQGCRETPTSKPRRAVKPAVALAMSGAPIGRPDIAPPMPRGLPLSPAVLSDRADAITAIATHPWSPLVALRGVGQVVLYDTEHGNLGGVLPFAPGQPEVLRFSRSGELLIAGGGVGGRSGQVAIWSVGDGARVSTVGDEFDVVLAADIDPSQRFIALGGPARVVKVYDVREGNLIRRIEKHTEWITAVAYSPDGILLASADRNGRLFVWEAESGAPFYALGGHDGAITSMDWRADGDVLATTGEDGQIKLWEMYGGTQVKAWAAHGGGALSVRLAHDGRLVSTGRDRAAKVWMPDGNLVRAIEGFADITLSAAFTTDGASVVVGDYAGAARVVRIEDGIELGRLAANPAPYEQQLQAVMQGTAAAQTVVESGEEAWRAAARDVADKQHALADADATFAEAQAAATSASKDQAATEQAVAESEQALAGAESQLRQFQDQLAAADAALHSALESLKACVERETARQARVTSLQALLSTAQQASRAAAESAAAAIGNAALARLGAEAAAAVESTEAALADARHEVSLAGADRTTATTTIDTATIARDSAVAAEQAARLAVQQRSADADAARNTRSAQATAQETLTSQVGAAQQALELARQAVAASEAVQADAHHVRAQALAGLGRAKRVEARWQAEGVRLQLAAARELLSTRTAAYEPTRQESLVAQQAAEAATIRLTRAEKRLEDMPQRFADAENRFTQAEAELARSRDWQAAAEAVIAPHERIVAEFEQTVNQLRDHSASRPDSTALQEAVEHAGRALDLLRVELDSRRTAVETGQLALEEAEFDLQAAEEARAALATEQEGLPAGIEDLRLAADAAHQRAADARARAERAQAPVTAAAHEVDVLNSQFVAWLDRAAPSTAETAP
jgi:hypothetical protein